MKFFQIEWECRKVFRNVFKNNYTIAQENLWQSLSYLRTFSKFYTVYGISWYRGLILETKMPHWQCSIKRNGRLWVDAWRKSTRSTTKLSSLPAKNNNKNKGAIVYKWHFYFHSEVNSWTERSDMVAEGKLRLRLRQITESHESCLENSWTLGKSMNNTDYALISACARENQLYNKSYSELMVPTRRILITHV